MLFDDESENESDQDDYSDFNCDQHALSASTASKDVKVTAAANSNHQHVTAAPSTSSGSSAHLMELNVNKAGMEGLDKEKINQIIEAASKGSKFYEHKKKQQKRVDTKIAELLDRRKSITAEQLKAAEQKVDALVKKLEKTRDLSRTIVHVDMDAFYAAVEMRDNEVLRDKPMAVGGEGMLSTSNYAARRFGVRAAMPGFIARKLCPQLVIVPPNFAKYREVSAVVGSVFARYDPDYAALSLDEAYLDVTEFLRDDCNLRLPDDGAEARSHAEKVVADVRAEIFAETGLTASAGIAPNAFLAKVCSDINKPDGQFYLEPDVERVRAFVRDLPVRKAFGVGKVTEQLLSSLGVVTCRDLFDQRALLSLLFTEASAMSFLRISLGLGATHVGSDAPAKSVSTEQTFRDSCDGEFLREKCKRLCEELSCDLRKRGLTAETVTLKLKTNEFDVKTRARRLPDHTSDADVFWRHVRPLLETELGGGAVSFRLMGVRASTLRQSVTPNSSTTTTGHREHQRTLKDLMANVPSRQSSKDCPLCSVSLRGKSVSEINAHIDACLLVVERPEISDERGVECPVCAVVFPESKIQFHVESCLSAGSSVPSVNATPSSVVTNKRKAVAPVENRAAKRGKKATQVPLDAFFKRAAE